MSELVRCPCCNGAKKVPKLGNIIGECNACDGTGKIKECDVVKPIVNEPNVNVDEIIEAVESALPVSNLELSDSAKAKKIELKRALYKRKTA